MPKLTRCLILLATVMLTASGCTATTNNFTQQVVVANVQGGTPALPAGGILACSLESTLKSISDTHSFLMTFQNETDSDLKLFWLGYDGQRKLYADIPQSQAHRRPTFITHPWVVADKDGECIEIVMPGRDTQTVVIRTTTPLAAAPQTSAPQPVITR